MKSVTHQTKAGTRDEGLGETTLGGIRPTMTVGETYAPSPVSVVSDTFALFKPRVTSLVVLSAWAGYYMAAREYNAPRFDLHLGANLLGIALVSSCAATLNQILERREDARMLRTRNRPLPAKRMNVRPAAIIGTLIGVAGTTLLALVNNPLTALLALATAVAYCFVYTPLKVKSPISTFVGAFPGAMPAVLGWVGVTGRFDWESLALFAIGFFWQFPHFLAIAWLYREDYERAGIRMLPVVKPDGESTIRRILGYGAALIPISLMPTYLGIAGRAYFLGAVILGVGYLYFGLRLAMLKLPATSALSKKQARQLLQASVIYLPLLFILMMVDGVK
jgi:protoheme IX farnesyltransferase